MTFEEILDQAIALLQRRGRLTYGALKRQFQLDDAYLEDLKAELIEGQRVAVDEEGRVLVWTGGAAVPPLTATTLLPTRASAQTTPAPAIPAIPDAERRQLTVMFCDLVDSTRLASQLDPEDWREVVRAYQAACAEVITGFDGHIAQLLGDGLLVYFGWPQAHEDDAQRAVRTGLEIVAALGDLNTRLQREHSIQLALRMGIHTGLVVVGAMESAGRQEQLALGDVPNIAARLQGMAEPNTILLSADTYRLIQGYFECQNLGAQALRGVATPIHVYRVLQESGARGRLDVAQPRGLTPLVGRESEVTLLLERWKQAKAGHGHVVLLSAESGLGKSRLVQVLKDYMAHEPHVRWECRSVPYYQNAALFPLVELFQRILRFEAQESPDAKLEKLEHALSQYRLPLEESVPLFAPLLALPVPEHRYPSLNLSLQRQRQKTLETIVVILLELAEHQPVLFIVEDLHWTDPTTLELLNLVLDQTPTAALLVLLTCRPQFQPAWHHRSYITEMTLNHLPHTQVEQIVHCITDGNTLPPEVLHQILAKTDGVPLFVEEMTKAILESDRLTAVDGHYALTGSFATLAIPATLQDSLMARLDRLVTAKAVAQYAAIIGRQFSYDLLYAVSQLDEATLQRELGRLVAAEIVYQHGLPPQATYTFKHALIQDAAAQSLLKRTKQHYHQRIAQVLEAQFPETAETQPELLAHHYTEAGLIAQAVGYWQRAGQQAKQRSANLEAMVHLEQGLALLMTLPDTPARTQRELDFQMALGPVLMATKGYAAKETGSAYTRARKLCQHVGESPQLFSVLYGLCLFYIVRAELQTARELGEQLLSLAQRQHDPAQRLVAHQALGATLFHSGEFAASRQHSEQGLALYNSKQHHALTFVYGHNFGVVCGFYAAWALWCLGALDASEHRSHEALTLARELSHPYSLAWSLQHAARLHYCRRQDHMVHERTDELMALCTEQGFEHYAATGTFLRGWVLAAQGQGAEGIIHMRQGLDVSQAMGTGSNRPTFLAMLAEAYGQHGQVQEGMRVLIEAQAAMDQSGEHWYEAELHRLRGELLRHTDDTMRMAEVTPEVCFQRAIDIARQQEAKSWELRAATSLARLWRDQSKCQEARELLVPVYHWFTEGFDTADLRDAKALLEALA